MKNTLLSFVLIVVLSAILLNGCSGKKSSPVIPDGPAATPSFTVTRTYLSCTKTTTTTVSPTPTVTATQTNCTNTMTPTASVTQVIFTATVTSTFTQSPTTMATIAYSDLISVPSGTFNQEDTSQLSFSHTVSAFKIGKYQVTYELWYTVYQWAINNGYSFAYAGTEGCCGTTGLEPTSSKYQPVTAVCWRDTVIWCNAFSQMSGMMPAYCSDAGFSTPVKTSTNSIVMDSTAGSVDNPYVNWNSNGYRLPTEGEYQYAASYIDGINWIPYDYASGATANCDDAVATNLVGWSDSNSGAVTHNVGEKMPNALGAYDMSGNVFEWCWDWYGDYPTDSQVDYRGPVGTYIMFGSLRMYKGGYYNCGPGNLRVGIRAWSSPNVTDGNFGFRFAKSY